MKDELKKIYQEQCENNISILIDDYIFYKIIKMTLHDVFFPLHAILAE